MLVSDQLPCVQFLFICTTLKDGALNSCCRCQLKTKSARKMLSQFIWLFPWRHLRENAIFSIFEAPSQQFAVGKQLEIWQNILALFIFFLTDIVVIVSELSWIWVREKPVRAYSSHMHRGLSLCWRATCASSQMPFFKYIQPCSGKSADPEWYFLKKTFCKQSFLSFQSRAWIASNKSSCSPSVKQAQMKSNIE